MRMRLYPFAFFVAVFLAYYLVEPHSCGSYFLLVPGFLPLHWVMGTIGWVGAIVIMPTNPLTRDFQRNIYKQNMVWLEDDRREVSKPGQRTGGRLHWWRTLQLAGTVNWAKTGGNGGLVGRMGGPLPWYGKAWRSKGLPSAGPGTRVGRPRQ